MLPSGQRNPMFSLTPEERREHARRAARARWNKVYQRRLRQLVKVEDQAFDAQARALAMLDRHAPVERKALAREVRRLFAAFCTLHQLDGHNLPEDRHAYLQGVTDYLKGEVTKRDGT